MSAVAAVRSANASGAEWRRRLRAALPALSLALVIAAIAWLNPRAISYFGFTLMLNLAIPIALATMAQMFVIAGNDLDLSIGTFVGFVCCVAATWLHDTPWLGVLALIGCIALYAALGALIYLRNLPSIVVTLGMSFVWQGLAILLLPKPGGKAPGWLLSIMGVKPPFIPFPIVAAVIIAAVGYFGLMRTSYGAILRASGGNALAIERAGWSLLRAKMTLFALAGVFGVLSGMALVGITTSADANIGNGYTLLSIAGVILGGGEFVGGVGVASRRRARRAHHGDGGLAAPDLHAHPAGLAGRRQWRDPHHRSRRSRRHHPQGVGPMTAFQTLLKRPWIWSFVGAALVWLAAIVFTGGYGAGGMLTAALSLAVFTVIVGVGQMFVITLGPGNVDLSLPANIGLASAVAMKTMGGDDRLVLVGLAAAIACGLAVGLANYLLIWALRIPPIIATLSASFIIQSIDISYGRGLQIKPPPGFADFTNIVIAGVPVLAILTVLFTIGASIALHRTIWGRSVVGIGQNQRAARLAGLKVEPVRCATYALCGALGGLNGALLAGYFRGANIDIGNEYLLASIAVVVIGGTSVSGGRANLPGVWGGALFLVLLLTMLNTFGVSAGVRLLLTGLIIVAVITAAGGEKATR